MDDKEIFGRMVIDDNSLFIELLKIGSDVERCKLLVIDVDKSSEERIRAGINVDECSNEPTGV